MKRLTDKIAIVTGGGGGIGSAVARRFVSEGAKVAVADVFLTSAQTVVESLGDAAIAVQFDASDAASVKGMVEKTVNHFGRLDILHNNAAMTDPVKSQMDTDAVTIPIDIWDEVIDVNLRGYMLGCKYAIPHMIAGGGGSMQVIWHASLMAHQKARSSP
jgi:NAD(P)-dependent dehydrogenase (short-subunit alcohol dehydrogenase family)